MVSLNLIVEINRNLLHICQTTSNISLSAGSGVKVRSTAVNLMFVEP